MKRFFLIALVFLTGCASTGDLKKTNSQLGEFAGATEKNMKIIATAHNKLSERVKKLEDAAAAVPAPEPVRNEKGQFTPAATNVPKKENPKPEANTPPVTVTAHPPVPVVEVPPAQNMTPVEKPSEKPAAQS